MTEPVTRTRPAPWFILIAAGLAAGLGACATIDHGAASPARTRIAVVGGEERPAPAIPMGSDATIRRILDEGMHRNRVMDHLTYLCTEFGPRLTGSTAAENAGRWARDQFESWGLSNAHLDEWGTIAVRFDRGPSVGKVLRRREVEGESGETEVRYDELRELQITTLAWARGTDGPTRGPLVKMPHTEEEFEAVKDRIAGSWILIGPEPGGWPGIRGVGGLMRTRSKHWHELRTGAAGQGKVADPDAPAEPEREFPADGFSGEWRGRLVGPRVPEGTEVVLIVERSAEDGSITGTLEIPGYHSAAIENAAFDPDGGMFTFTWPGPAGDSQYALSVADQTMTGEATAASGDLYTAAFDRPAAAGAAGAPASPGEPAEPEGPSIDERILALGPLGFVSGSNDERVWTTSADGWRELDYYDVPRDIEVLVSGPDYDYLNSRLYDQLPIEVMFDLRHSFENGPIPVYNTVAEIPGTEWPHEVVIVSAHLDSWDGPGSQGTVDNGTGSAVTLETARILMAAGARPKRTIRFILWTGEEQGLLGSRSYVERHADEMANVSAIFVDDGGTNYQGGLGAADNMVEMLAAATAPVNNVFYSETDGKYLNVNVRPTGRRMQSHGGSDHASFLRVGVPGFFWDEEGRANYGRGWHTQFDRLDQAIEEYLVQSATCSAITVYNLACAPTLLPREEPAAEGEEEQPRERRRRGRPAGNPAPTN